MALVSMSNRQRCCTLAARPSRNALSRAFAAGSPCATPAINASRRRQPAAGPLSGDARQRLYQREVGERRIAGDFLRDF